MQALGDGRCFSVDQFVRHQSQGFIAMESNRSGSAADLADEAAIQTLGG